MKHVLIAIFCAFTALSSFAGVKRYNLTSPDGKISIDVVTGNEVTYSVKVDDHIVLAPSKIGMKLTDGTVFGGSSTPRSAKTISVNNQIEALCYTKKQIVDLYKELKLSFSGYELIFRAYNDGVAYRFVSKRRKPFQVLSETADFSFPASWPAFIPYVCQNDKGEFNEQLHNSFESPYTRHAIASWDKKHLAFLPLMIEADHGVKLCITESDLLDYPGMFLYNGDCDNTLSGYFPEFALEKSVGDGDGRSLYVQKTAPYIAECEGECTFPWRAIGISRNDVEMANNDLVYKLASAPDSKQDFSWVKPGKVAWDWWNAMNIYGVDFKSGVNNETYKYYIDFASKFGIQYVIMDEGWSIGFEDLFHVVPQIDLKGLIAYAEERGVGIILWAGYGPFQKDVEKACKIYSEMGVKGFKVDFMDACDQDVVRFHRDAASIAAKYHMLMDFHGTYKPTGLHRTYPNVINYEGVYGLENMKWADEADQVTYDVTIPYIRFFAGPADYTQGAMRNATKGNFRAVHSEAMSQGTRCRQLAQYVIFSSPLNMLCDAPSNYLKEIECTEYIASVPEVWDETVAIDGKVGEYIVLARRKNDTWYVGALTNWDSRDIEINLDFIKSPANSMTIFRDGVNADKVARDYKKVTTEYPKNKVIKAHLAPGGGFVAIIKESQL